MTQKAFGEINNVEDEERPTGAATMKIDENIGKAKTDCRLEMRIIMQSLNMG